MTGARSEQGSFGLMLKKYRNGTLKNAEMKIIRVRNFEVIEHKLVQYLKLQESKYKRDKLGTLWLLLTEKFLEWGKYLDLNRFQCSSGWLNSNLKFHGMGSINLHGEADDLIDE